MGTEIGSAAGRNGAAVAGGAGRAAGLAARGAGMAVALLIGLLAGVGWLYVLRGLGWLDLGPRVNDALPLLQLPGFDAQPLARVAVAWISAGAVAAIPLVRVSRPRRALIAWLTVTALLLLASQASFALARNLRLGDVVSSRSPGLGPWLEGLLFAVGCALPGPKARGWGDRDSRVGRIVGGFKGARGRARDHVL
jgi:hypothetical protein